MVGMHSTRVEHRYVEARMRTRWKLRRVLETMENATDLGLAKIPDPGSLFFGGFLTEHGDRQKPRL